MLPGSTTAARASSYVLFGCNNGRIFGFSVRGRCPLGVNRAQGTGSRANDCDVTSMFHYFPVGLRTISHLTLSLLLFSFSRDEIGRSQSHDPVRMTICHSRYAISVPSILTLLHPPSRSSPVSWYSLILIQFDVHQLQPLDRHLTQQGCIPYIPLFKFPNL